MYKKTVDYEQGRTRRVAEFTRLNNYGVDPTAFSENNKKLSRELVDQMKELEFKLASINRTMHSAHQERTAIGDALRSKLEEQREAVKDKLAEIRLQIAALKAERDGFARQMSRENHRTDKREQRQQQNATFEREFIHMAKMMLAGEIFDRILVATIQKIREEFNISDREARVISGRLGLRK